MKINSVESGDKFGFKIASNDMYIKIPTHSYWKIA